MLMFCSLFEKQTERKSFEIGKFFFFFIATPEFPPPPQSDAPDKTVLQFDQVRELDFFLSPEPGTIFNRFL